MSDNETIVRNFIAAWSRLDVNELVGYFTEDGTYHNMMAKPVSGHENLRTFISRFLKGWTATEWDIVNIVSGGDVVIAERLDRTRIGDKKGRPPVRRRLRDAGRQDQGLEGLLRPCDLHEGDRLRRLEEALRAWSR